MGYLTRVFNTCQPWRDWRIQEGISSARQTGNPLQLRVNCISSQRDLRLGLFLDFGNVKEWFKSFDGLGTIMDDIASANGQAVPQFSSVEWDHGAGQSVGGTTMHSGLPVRWTRRGPATLVRGSRAEFAIKRLFDIVCASAGLIVLSALFLVVAILIKASSAGPVFFRQQREGLDGKLFWALKFRSMRVDQCDLSGVAQTVSGDPRVTPIGKFLRKTSIDELPQLINVLRGDMSLVGPRPHVPGMLAAGRDYREVVPYYSLRLAVRPGITGWAQANGWRGPTSLANDARERVDHDIAYIQNFSLWLDIKILVRTVVREFLTGSGH